MREPVELRPQEGVLIGLNASAVELVVRRDGAGVLVAPITHSSAAQLTRTPCPWLVLCRTLKSMSTRAPRTARC